MTTEIDERPPVLTSEFEEGRDEGQALDHEAALRQDSLVNVKHQELDQDQDAEKDIVGQVVEGADGEFYLVAPNDEQSGDVDIDEISHVRIMIDDNGGRLFIVDNDKNENSQSKKDQGSQNIEMTTDLIREESSSMAQQYKGRRNRVYGSCRCNECGQSFVNTARLERHLAVHQVFGNFSCPLCTKTYKYEYNLFYHWRKTCRDLDEVFTQKERKDLDVNTLRQAVEDLVRKKRDYVEVGINARHLYHVPHMQVPVSPTVRRTVICRECGVNIFPAHMQIHLNLHRGVGQVGEPDCGCYYCDLCGLMFRQYGNLMKHWRVACQEIQANLPEVETIDDDGLKAFVLDLMQHVVIHSDFQPEQREVQLKEKARIYDSVTGDLDFEGPVGMEGGEYGEQQGPLVFTDDVIDDEVGMAVSADFTGQNREKWVPGQPVQCHECKRAFANTGRLERHMAGYHATSGSHHCPLCGNRFKYDYNLLYHYRHSCAYTKSYIDTEMRQQLDAQTLRKLVRELAAKDLRVTNAELSLTGNPKKQHYGDDYVRREMLGRDAIKNLPQLPPNRPGIPEGKPCPLCGITFYGLPVLQRHVRAAHPRDAYLFDPHTGTMRESIPMSSRSSGSNMTKREVRQNQFSEELDNSGDLDQDNDEPPPQLEKINESDQNEEEQELLHLVDSEGRIISQVHSFEEVQELIDSGHLGLSASDRFVLMDRHQNIHSELVYERNDRGGQYVFDGQQEIYYDIPGENGPESIYIVQDQNQRIPQREIQHRPSTFAENVRMSTPEPRPGPSSVQEEMNETQDLPSTSDSEMKEDSVLTTDQEMKDVSELGTEGEKEAKKRSPRKSYIRDVCDLPQTKMRALVAAAYPDTNVDEDALIALTKAAELFVSEVARKSVLAHPNKTHINYDEIAATVRAEKKKPYTFLRSILPHTRPFGEVKKLVTQADENEDPDDEK
ncbi:hypothetical protein FO519_004859 [Halicephalobus sp. NKZ332]|nr:hypothetical protein FO519_004859 [Halicephalobus sp. NKZ332]